MSGRFLAVSTTMALALWGCGGGGGEAEQEAAPPAATPETAPAPQMGAPAGQLPPGVTPAMVDEGRTLFHGAGICFTCHGQNGVGMPQLGAALNDAEWLHSDGSFDAIVNQINTGVTAAQSKTGTVMPPKGGAVTLTDEQVRAIAAYVYSLRGA
jgi:mono/diheme cytochrome c family protein